MKAKATINPAMHRSAISDAQLADYRAQGFVLLTGVFTEQECDAVVSHMMDLAAKRKSIAGFPAIDTTRANWGRTHNQHLYDPAAMDLLLHPKLRAPLEAICGGAVDGVQTMYFWQGSEQRRHQDQYYLPSCFSAWCALCDVTPQNGTLFVQPGSHLRKLVKREDLPRKADGTLAEVFGEHYNDAVDALFHANAIPEVPVLANKGDVLLFDGKLIHRGGPVLNAGSHRHVMANHYIPYDFDGWPYDGWPRFSFDREKRLTDPKTKITRAADSAPRP